MGNEKANSYWEAELPPNYYRVGIENFIHAKIKGGSLRMRKRFKKGWPQGDNNDIVTEVGMGMLVTPVVHSMRGSTHKKVSPGAGALPHLTSQTTQPIAVAESINSFIRIKTCNFSVVEEEPVAKIGVAKADHRKCQSAYEIDDLFKDSSILSSSVSTSSLSDKPPKDVKNDIMNLFDKVLYVIFDIVP
ncbi:hypothetical protein CQW23_21894 [Capsicum baccatum]|uniref:Uncharacterized protein n=1 Tax=Capsicum baccatum TaxID=33114 RepID=A0A2G2VZD5_CAPBA|nr:hypothetical protein CQW23_21894 [Capsicum baccatum]